MSEDPAAKPRAGLLTWALWGVALIGVAAVVYIIGRASSNPPEVASVPRAAPAGAPLSQKLSRPATPTPPPDYAFVDEQGKPVRIADHRGKVVVMNIWATWCPPCKAEMPTLAKLAEAYRGQPVEVIAVSIDKPEAAAEARLFIAANAPLKFYIDPEGKLVFRLKPAAAGAPTTVIYGKDGLEKARVSGEADWTSGEAKALVDAALRS